MQLMFVGEIVIVVVWCGQCDFDNVLMQVEDLCVLWCGYVNFVVFVLIVEKFVFDVIFVVMQCYLGVMYSVCFGNGESIVCWVEMGEVDIGYVLCWCIVLGVVEVCVFVQLLGVVMVFGYLLVLMGGKVCMCDCFVYLLILMMFDMELCVMFDQIDVWQLCNVWLLVEIGLVLMVWCFVVEGVGVGFLIVENVVDDVVVGWFVWMLLVDVGVCLFSCIYQWVDMSVIVVMMMFFEFFFEVIDVMEYGFVCSGLLSGMCCWVKR